MKMTRDEQVMWAARLEEMVVAVEDLTDMVEQSTVAVAKNTEAAYNAIKAGQTPPRIYDVRAGGWVPAGVADARTTIKILQRTLGVSPDGIIGPDTLRALIRGGYTWAV